MRTTETGANRSPRRLRAASGYRIAHASTLALAIGFATPAFAQISEGPAANAQAPNGQPADQADTPAQNAIPASDDQLGDVVVTARRVAERLQDIPASVAAVTGDQVTRMNSLADIQSMVSGVTFRAIGPIPAVGIRGYGNRPTAGFSSNTTVGIFQDGVFIAPTLVTQINRVDSGRVEVAKGPQSILYGRSSFTGAINIVSNDPSKDFSGYVDAGYGGSSVYGEDLWHVRGAVSVPLTNTLAIRVFGLREKRDGFSYDPVTNFRGLGYDRKIGRVRLLWEPSDSVAIRLTGTIIRDNNPQGTVHSGRNNAPLGALPLFANPTSAASRNSLVFGKDVWTGTFATPNSNRTRGEQVTLDARFQTPIGELASLTDYQKSKSELLLSLDLTRLGFARGDTPYNERRFSQELRLSNTDGPVSYLLGAYLLHVTSNQSGGKIPDLTTPFAAFGPGALLYDLRGIRAIFQPSYTKNEAYAFFGQAGYDFTDKLNLTVGLRRGRDEISGTTGTFFGLLSGALIPATPTTYRRVAFDSTTGSANLSYKVAPDVIAYASFARGDSPAGLNAGGAALITYGQQKVDAYELGLKSQLLNRHLQLNVAVFDNEYKNLQIAQNIFINGALTTLIQNAGAARGRGVDLDAVGVLSSNFRVGVQYTYVDSKLTRYTVPAAPAPQVDFTGIPLVRSPKHTLNGSITYTQPIGPGRFQFTAEESYQSSYTNDYQGSPAGFAYPGIPGQLAAGTTTSQVLALFRTPGYAVTNLNASYTFGPWELSGFVRNVFNKQYIGSVVAFDTVTYPNESPGEPRTFEASLKFSF
ncbi:TonB-dependent receptor [Sphingomonas sp.]|uniref:TonB-dependent receptor n=1 Tax=Sphingomonas sp. TaxID=28214 RepID=UPI0035BC3930